MSTHRHFRNTALRAAGIVLALGWFSPKLIADAQTPQEETPTSEPPDSCHVNKFGVTVSPSPDQPFLVAQTIFDENCQPHTTVFDRTQAVANGIMTEEDIDSFLAQALATPAPITEAPTPEPTPQLDPTAELGSGAAIVVPNPTYDYFIVAKNELWDAPDLFNMTWVQGGVRWNRATEGSGKSYVTNYGRRSCDSGHDALPWSTYDDPDCYIWDAGMSSTITTIKHANFRYVSFAYDHWQEAWANGHSNGTGTVECYQEGEIPFGSSFRCLVASQS